MRQRFPSFRVVLLAVVALASLPLDVAAQLRRPKAEVAPLVASDGVRAGGHGARGAEGDAARGAARPVGHAARPVAHPDGADGRSAGRASTVGNRLSRRRPTSAGRSAEPLAVFEHEFVIGVAARGRRNGRAATRRPGAAALPGLRRQAVLPADDADVQWTLRRRGAGAAADTGARDVFGRSRSARGEAPRRRRAAPRRRRRAGRPRRDGLAHARRLRRCAARPAAIWHADDFLQFVRDAESGVQQKGCFEGRGPLAILLLVLARRPGAEPHALRAADDADQPGDHRRRRAGRLAPPRVPARRAPTAPRWRSSTACSA